MKKQRRDERHTLFEQLRLQAEILCDSRDAQRERAVLSRMLNLILDVTKQERRLNAQTRQVLADHFSDCAYDGTPDVELGGPYNRNALHLSGSFDVEELSKRIVWASERYREIVEAKVQK